LTITVTSVGTIALISGVAYLVKRPKLKGARKLV
jgi:hypothetical protein